jgi:voltage-dependent calcium channel T type alpha-1G
MKNIGNVFCLVLAFFIVYGVIGVQLFKGKMYHCVGESMEYENILTKNDCLRNPHNKWINAEFNFDHIGSALMSLFILTNKDGWSDLMYKGIDAVGVDRQPIENYNEWMLIYFISFLLLVGFLMSNLFVGVIIDSFQKNHQSNEISNVSPNRLLAKTNTQHNNEVIHSSFIKRYAQLICKNSHFDQIIGLVIMLSITLLSFEHHGMNSTTELILTISNLIFTLIFSIEALIRIIAEGLLGYFKKRWNLLDIGVLLLAIIQIVIDYSSFSLIESNVIKLLRIIRIVRVLKLVKMANGIRNLINTVILALPQVKTLILLFFLLYFTFASVGVKLFGHIRCDDFMQQCNGIGRHANFQSFGMSVLTLFRIATIDRWSEIMKVIMNYL